MFIVLFKRYVSVKSVWTSILGVNKQMPERHFSGVGTAITRGR